MPLIGLREPVIGSTARVTKRLFDIGVARVGLSIFYFTIFVPFGVAARLSGNLLGPRASAKASYWQPRPAREAKVSDAQKQF